MAITGVMAVMTSITDAEAFVVVGVAGKNLSRCGMFINHVNNQSNISLLTGYIDIVTSSLVLSSSAGVMTIITLIKSGDRLLVAGEDSTTMTENVRGNVFLVDASSCDPARDESSE